MNDTQYYWTKVKVNFDNVGAGYLALLQVVSLPFSKKINEQVRGTIFLAVTAPLHQISALQECQYSFFSLT